MSGRPNRNSFAEAQPLQPIPTGRIGLLAASSFAASASMRVCDAMQPALRNDFDLQAASVAGVIVGFSLAYGACQIPLGMAGDRFGKSLLIVIACAVSAMAAFACALAPDYPSLVTARVLAGAAAAAIIPLSIAWVGDHVHYSQRQVAMSRFTLGQMFGVAAGQALGGLAADSLPWRLAFVGLGVWFGAAALGLIAARMGDGRQPAPEAAAGTQRLPEEGNFRALIQQRRVLALLVIAAAEGAGVYGALAFLALHLHEMLGWSLSRTGFVSVLFGCGGLLYVGGASRLVHRLGERRLCAVGAVLMAVSLIALGMGHHGPLVVAWLISLGLGYYMMHSTLQVQATQVAPHARGRSVALFATCFFSGQGLGVALVGYARAWIPTGALIAACGIFVLMSALLYARQLQRMETS